MSTNRPSDFGDQHPSDLDDVAPGDPTEGYTEVNYDVESNVGRNIKSTNPSDIAPDPGIENDTPLPVRTWFAIILDFLNPLSPLFLNDAPAFQYLLLRQDGKIVAGYVVNEELYEQYRVGHDVLIRADNDQAWDSDRQNHWIIVGKQRPDELPTLDVYLSSDTECKSGDFIVPYDIINSFTPIDNTFGGYDELRLVGPGSITANRIGQALYHIEFTVTIEHCNPVPDSDLDYIWFAEGCYRENFSTFERASPLRAPKLFFNEQNGFRIYYDSDDCTANLTLGSTCKDSILNQQETRATDPAFWTDSPKLGGSLSVGTVQPHPYVKIGNDKQYVWLTHGFGRLKFRFPSGPPAGTPAFLVAKAVSGECVQTDWMPPGGTGVIQILAPHIFTWQYCYIGEDYCAIPYWTMKQYTWNVCKGLIASGPGITPNPWGNVCAYGSGGTAYCPEDDKCDDDPCNFVDD